MFISVLWGVYSNQNAWIVAWMQCVGAGIMFVGTESMYYYARCYGGEIHTI